MPAPVTSNAIASCKAVEEINAVKKEPTNSFISKFPLEIVVLILAHVAIDSPQSFIRILLLGSDFRIPYNSPLLWEPMCKMAYPELSDGSIDVDAYGGYYNMFRQRPAVRHNGVYICIAQYSRPGVVTGISFNPPRHVVTYFRYLWLASDGSARSLLSNSPPKVVLGISGTPSEDTFQDLMHGSWKLHHETKVLNITVDGGLKRKNYFNFELEISSSGGKCHNKLKWKRYWCVDYDYGCESDFLLKNEASYYFCKLPVGKP